MSQEFKPNPKKINSGNKSLIAVGVILITFIPLFLWASLPQYQGPGGFGMGMMMGFGLLFFWFPMMITTIVLSIRGLCKNDGRGQGLIALISVLAFLSWMFFGWK
jgi:hypothetical protein